MRARILFPLLGLLFFYCLPAQDTMFQRLSFPVIQYGKNLGFPFAGGLNAAQFSAADLNNDHIQDLVIFDRAGDVLLTLLNEGTPNTTSYRYVPEYACNFPALKNYVLMRDFDRDGAADIFCASLQVSGQEMQVFKGYFEKNALKFKPFLFNYPGCSSCDNRLISYPSTLPGYWNNLFIPATDYPAVDDIDGDGDLDILTFDGTVGGHIWLAQNMSVEMGFGLDSLKYYVTDRCWGRFYESGLLACENDLSPKIDSCSYAFAPGTVVIDREERHPGSTIMVFDQDGDGDMELVTGDISFPCFNMMTNGGNKQVAWMTAQDIHFPSYSTPVDLNIFPTPFYLDLNNDGRKDLVAAPNSKFANDDRQGVWYYPNAAATGHDFKLSTKNLFIADMIDLGSAAHPVLADVDADGLLDLVVGNYGYYTPASAQNASLYLFRNTGSATEPAFTLTDPDWQGLSEFAPNDYDFYPAFGDLDGDGDADLLVGSNLGALYYYRNVAGPGQPMQFQRDFNTMWLAMDIGSYSTPAIIDLDQDGLKDIVMGERNGNLNFFKNTGATDNPLFAAAPTLSKIGAVDTRVPPSDVGYSIPVFVGQPNGTVLLVTGTQEGHIEAYDNIQASESAFNTVSARWGNVDEGNRSSPAFGDLDGDGILEMVVGNLRGGLSMFKTALVSCTTGIGGASPASLKPAALSPNPARAWVRVEWPVEHAVEWQAFDRLGRSVARGSASGGAFIVAVNDWAEGLYYLDLRSGGRRTGRSIVVAR